MRRARTVSMLKRSYRPKFLQCYREAALCDEPGDVATGGGFRFDGVLLSDPTTAVVTSTSCAASGLCGGTGGLDGWIVVAKSDRIITAGIRITAYVVCAQP